MNTGRYLPQRDYDRLAVATHQLVDHDKVGGCKRAAQDITRGDAARLSRYGNKHETMRAPIDVVADLEAAAGEPVVTRVLADLAGYHLVPKCVASADRADVLNHLSATMARFSVLHQEAMAAIADDTVDELEKLAIRGSIKLMQQQLACFERDLEPAAPASTPVSIRSVA